MNYIKIKTDYLELKKYILYQNGGKHFRINDNDTVISGDDGSSAIIVITEDKKVYKVFTLYKYISDLNMKKKLKKNQKRVNNEINIYKFLTKNIINKNISNHIVKYINSNNYTGAKELFYKKCPKTYLEYLNMENGDKTKMCNDYFSGYPNTKINDTYKVVQIEYCDYSCKQFIIDISKMHIFEMEKYLDIFFFQIIYTIMSIQKIYPYFTHNDLFIRNILGVREKDNGNYYTYKFNNKMYYVPQKKFYPKINDFGITNLNSTYNYSKLYKSQYKDIYNILFDVYDGQNLGSNSLSSLCHDDSDKLIFIKNYFSTYFNVDVIDKYKENSKNEMNWNWSNILDDKFLKSINMVSPIELLNGYFYNIFNKINKNI